MYAKKIGSLEIDPDALGGYIAAFDNLSEELIKSGDSEVREVILADNTTLVKISGKLVNLVLVVDKGYDTNTIELASKQIINEFENKYSSHFDKNGQWDGKVREIHDFDSHMTSKLIFWKTYGENLFYRNAEKCLEDIIKKSKIPREKLFENSDSLFDEIWNRYVEKLRPNFVEASSEILSKLYSKFEHGEWLSIISQIWGRGNEKLLSDEFRNKIGKILSDAIWSKFLYLFSNIHRIYSASLNIDGKLKSALKELPKGLRKRIYNAIAKGDELENSYRTKENLELCINSFQEYILSLENLNIDVQSKIEIAATTPFKYLLIQ